MSFIRRVLNVESGYEKRRRETKEMIREIMMTITHNTISHAEVIARGPVEWRNHFLREMRGMAVDSNIADLVYVGICKAWKQAYGDQSAKQVLDKIEVKAPLTEKEIDEAWEHDASSSSWDARRRFYRDYPSKLPQEFNSTPDTTPATAPVTPTSSKPEAVH